MSFVFLLLGLYFSVLFSFSFVSHPIYYCILLLLSSFSVCGIVYTLIGFSWYVLLLCLVYVGGVYILFVFVSVYSPNTMLGCSVNSWIILSFFLFISWMFLGCDYTGVPCFEEFSWYLCSLLEGFTYILLCLVLVLGFVCISVIVNRKDSFYR